MTAPARHIGKAFGLFALVLTLSAASAGGAQAAGPLLRVTNLGQPSAPIEVGQPPIEIATTSDCAHPFTLANEAACPAGTWPRLGAQWGPIEDVAGGDTLRLELGSPVSGVSVGSTSNYEPGLTDPDGRPVSNYDVLPETTAVATADPGVWLATLPALDYRATSSIGYTFSVVVQDAFGSHGYPFGIRSPRYANELTRCGVAYFSTGVQQSLCLQGGVRPGQPGPHGHAKRLRCRKGFRKRTVRGKKRCVRVKKGHRR